MRIKGFVRHENSRLGASLTEIGLLFTKIQFRRRAVKTARPVACLVSVEVASAKKLQSQARLALIIGFPLVTPRISCNSQIMRSAVHPGWEERFPAKRSSPRSWKTTCSSGNWPSAQPETSDVSVNLRGVDALLGSCLQKIFQGHNRHPFLGQMGALIAVSYLSLG